MLNDLSLSARHFDTVFMCRAAETRLILIMGAIAMHAMAKRNNTHARHKGWARETVVLRAFVYYLLPPMIFPTRSFICLIHVEKKKRKMLVHHGRTLAFLLIVILVHQVAGRFFLYTQCLPSDQGGGGSRGSGRGRP